jgi:ArsR family transcriptional regulator
MHNEYLTLKHLRQTLKVLGDDTRLRILALLVEQDLTVKDICAILGTNQPTISKHLIKLRLSSLVSDKREGNFMYYSLNRNTSKYKLLHFLFSQFNDIEVFKQDQKRTKVSARNYCSADIERIRKIAYSLWSKAGKPKNEDLHFWLLGENKLKKEKVAMKGEKNGGSL